MPNVSIEYKNNVFCLLYQDRRFLLSLYNAMNGTDYQDENALEVVTLEHAICLSMKNDASFVIGSELNIYEHMSSVSENIPLRLLYYVVEQYKRQISMQTLYKRTRIKIPAPRFVVFYNGTEAQPEQKVLRLSDLYETKPEHDDLELTVTQYNINNGYNKTILENCESLSGYMVFVNKVREKTADDLPIKQAVKEAVDECIREDILADFFREHRNEVVEMGIFEFDAELYEQVLKEENRELGRTEGEISKLIQQICRKLIKGKSEETIAEELEEDLETIHAICAVASEYAPDYDAEKVIGAYLSKVSL